MRALMVRQETQHYSLKNRGKEIDGQYIIKEVHAGFNGQAGYASLQFKEQWQKDWWTVI